MFAWKLTIMSDKAENLHAALDWEVTLLAKNMSNAKLLTLLNKKNVKINLNPIDPNLCDMNKRSITLPSLQNQ